MLFYLSHRYLVRKDLVEQIKLEIDLEFDEENSITKDSDFFILNKLGEKILICEVLESSF